MSEDMSQIGVLESSQQLVDETSFWNQGHLRAAAARAALRNTGSPVGIVLNGAEAPVAGNDGIHARILSDRSPVGWDDYWKLDRRGRFYFARVFEEETNRVSWTTSEGHPERQLWFDVRIWRIAEVLLHSASLYEALGVDPSVPYLLGINHLGLQGRTFYSSKMQFLFRRQSVSHVPTASWSRGVTQDVVRADLSDLVVEVARELFVLFDFTEIDRSVIEGIIDNFRSSRL